MFESVLNSWAWWGLFAVSVPVIIHLINRLRYKRINWAAMEFLLKAMQRQKRKLIIEQLILLLLRCLLVLLVVLLIVRPTWFLGNEGSEAGATHHHIVLLDDSLSMHDLDDPRRPDAGSAFRHAAQLLADLADAHATSSANHYWTILTWSNPTAPELGAPTSAQKLQGTQMTTDEAARLRARLDEMTPTYYSLSPLPALQQAVKYLDAAKEGKKHLHIVSDFRRDNWQTTGEELYPILADLSKQGKVRLQFHDVARPERQKNPGEVPPAHGNMGITELVCKPRRTAETATVIDLPLKVVTPRLPFDVHVTVHNFGSADHRKVRVVLKSDGIVKGERLIDRLTGGEERKIIFNLEYGTGEPIGPKALSAHLSDPDYTDYLSVDDVRYGYVDLRSNVNVLLVDPDAHNQDTPSDWLFVSAALTGTNRTGVKADVITPRDLGRRSNLQQYAIIYLLNIAGVGRSQGDLDDEGLANLERYARAGGSLVFFLGPRTNVASFNQRLYQNGAGLFPAPLLEKPDPQGRSTTAYIDDEPDKEDVHAKLRFLGQHPAFPFTGDAADTLAKFIHVNRYFRVDPLWKAPEGTAPLVQLANRRPLVLYRQEAQTLASELNSVAGEIPEGKLTKYVSLISGAVADAEKKKNRKGELIEAISGALGLPEAANFWKDKKHADLKKRFSDFLSTLQQGDPLVIESTGGRGQGSANLPSHSGHVIAFLTPAAPTPVAGRDYPWNDIASGDLGQFIFVPMILGLTEHLAALKTASEFENHAPLDQEPLALRIDSRRYDPRVEIWFQPENQPSAKIDVISGQRVTQDKETGGQGDKGSTPSQSSSSNDWLVRVRASKGPGHYRLKFNQADAGNQADSSRRVTDVAADPGKGLETAKIPEEWPLAFNIQGNQEGDLTRISEEQLQAGLADGLQKGPSKTPLGEAREYVQGKNWFVLNAQEAQANEALQTFSWSDFSWVLLLFISLLLLEQFLAMKFSHHVV
jgi:hypothetical protein